MSGEWGEGFFVVVWDTGSDKPEVTQVTRWDDWIRINIDERPLCTTMVRAKDELDAYARATRGESWDETLIYKGANNA